MYIYIFTVRPYTHIWCILGIYRTSEYNQTDANSESQIILYCSNITIITWHGIKFSPCVKFS